MGIALIQALSLLTTLSRWTWFSALAGFLGIFAIVKHSHARLRVLAVVSFLSIVAISTAIISGYGPIVASWIGRMIYGTDTGYLSYHYELDLIKEVLSKRPFWGLGYNLPLEYFRRFNVDESLYLTDVGAGQGAFSYGEILIQTGLIGLSLYIGFWGILISNAMRITRHGNTDLARIVGALGVMALISGAFSGFHYGPLDVIGSDIYYYTLAAMIVAHSKRISPGQPEIVLPEAAHEIVKA
jgi:O-antigen ligase